MPEKLNIQIFIERAKKVHGDKYDYSKSVYTKYSDKIIIICPVHGQFEQCVADHLSGHGCNKCGNSLSTTFDFIQKAKNKHGDKYDYSNVIYNKSREKVKIICKIHGEFDQVANSHLKGAGCAKCNKNKKLTTEEFITRSKEKHGDKYDYSKVNYKNNDEHVIIICKIHGEFRQRPFQHLKGNGCSRCSNRNFKKLTTADFIKRAQEKHGDKYDYSQVNYENADKKVNIICPIHGIFRQSPACHLKHNCPKCADTKLSKDNFIEKSKIVHGNRYDYSNVIYKNNYTKVKIICIEHGEFKQRPSDHMSGTGCPLCGGCITLTTEEFIKRAKEKHGDKYDYTKTEYDNIYTKVEINCYKHGTFKQIPFIHLRGSGCQKCVNVKTLTNDEFIEKANVIHNNKYDYSMLDNINSRGIVKIICPKHGVFEQLSNNHLRGNGCPSCNYSKGEKIIEEYLLYHNINYELEKTFNDCIYKQLLYFDFYLPSLNMCIEYDGKQHFESISYYGGDEALKQTQIRDQIKTEYCKKNNIQLIRIRYDEIDNDLDDLMDILDEVFGLQSYDAE